MRGPLVAALLLLPFSSCVEEGATEPPGTSPPSGLTVPWAKVDARATLDDLRLFAEAYPFRQDANEFHKGARDWLAQRLKDSGLEVVRHAFQSRGFQGENILGFKWGEERGRWLVVGAHYDVVNAAAHGTYDDGSGTIEVLRLAQAYAKTPTNRTVVFALFDSEEKGLVGAKAFAQDVRGRQFQHNGTFEAMIDLDMVGITYPHPAKLVAWENSDELRSLSEDARRDVGVPDRAVEYRKPRGGSSDAKVFIDLRIPTIYYWSNWDDVVLKDGTRWQGSYPWWHQADTYATMVAMAGDEATLQAGFQTVLDVVSRVLADVAGGHALDVRAE